MARNRPIVVHAIVHLQRRGLRYAKILRDATRGVRGLWLPARGRGAVGGFIQVSRLFISKLSRVSPVAASRAVRNYFLLAPRLLDLTEEAIKLACLINEVVNVRYDSIHLALMLLNDIETVITNDVDWERVAKGMKTIRERAAQESFDVAPSELRVELQSAATWR